MRDQGLKNTWFASIAKGELAPITFFFFFFSLGGDRRKVGNVDKSSVAERLNNALCFRCFSSGE